LAHAGRKASHASPWKGGKQLTVQDGGWQAVAPSAIPFQDGTKAPEGLADDGIKKVIDDFKKAAVRAVDVGYDVLEIHAAHGYLIHEFLSPLTNQRNDSYGGSFENRIRLLLEILKGTQEIWPEHKPLFVRISASDWADGGWNIDESVKLSKILKQQGVDVIDCSSGGAVAHQKITLGPGYQVPFAERIKKEVGILTGTVGMITNAEQAEEILVSEKADLILIARESLRNPYFPLQAAKQLNDDIGWPDQYLRAK
jgi:2,4-dienoyl-CoA reductase-like NADH-dependent reductase (Old Yellow Enzyme family)